MFIGRNEELIKLRDLRRTAASNIAILYGRRRVGKSNLIREAFKNERTLFFEGIEGQNTAKQLGNFLFQLKQQVEDIEIKSDVKDWKNALIHLNSVIRGKNYVIILDEFQWMAAFRGDLVTELKMVWDQYLSLNPGTTLVLCGSIASFMIDKVVKSKALYGRIELEIRLLPFHLTEAEQMLQGHSKREVLESMLLLGGVPLYLKMIRNHPSIYLAINELGFRPNGYFTQEFNRVFLSHFGKKEHYESIIRALSKHSYGLFREDIARLCKIELSGHLSAMLRDLELAGFIKSFTPFDKGSNSKIKKFNLTDPYLNFFLKFIEEYKPKLSPERTDLFPRITQTAQFYSFLGNAFETFCQTESYTISTLLGFQGIDYSVGPYFRKDLSAKGIQIDLLFDRQDNVITLCEMKYSRSPIGVEVIRKVEAKSNELQKISRKTIQKVLIVKDEVTQDLIRQGYFYRIIRSQELFIRSGEHVQIRRM